MIIIFLACSSTTISMSGSAKPAGVPDVFISRCQQSDPAALLLQQETKTTSCEDAWDILSRIDSIDISDAEISDLSIFSGMTNLKKFSAYDNKITDLSPFIPLDRMEELYLMSNQISDISSLIHLRQLTVLRLDGNQVENIEVLPKLKRLNRLGLDNNQIRDFRPIAQLDDIQALNTNFNPVDVDKCPVKGSGPEQLHKYCKRMHKHHKKQEELKKK